MTRPAIQALALLLLAGCGGAPTTSGPAPTPPPPPSDVRSMEARNYIAIFATHDTQGWETAKQRLVKLGVPVLPVLFAAMQDQGGQVAFNCQDVLKRMGPDALSAVIQEIRAGDAGFTGKALTRRRLFRSQLITVVGEMRAPASAPALLEILRKDDWPTARRKAAFYLGELKAMDAVPDLIATLRADSAEDVRTSVLGALRRCAERDLGSNPEVWEAWWQERKPGS